RTVSSGAAVFAAGGTERAVAAAPAQLLRRPPGCRRARDPGAHARDAGRRPARDATAHFHDPAMIPIQSHTLSIDGLAKRFGKLPVLKGLDLQFERGSATAIIGHNGSGKTTLIKIILGLVRPDAGRLFFDGAKLNGQADYRARIGYMPQAARFPQNLTANELVSMLKDPRGNPGDIDKELIHDKHLIHDKELIHDEELIHAFRLAPELNKPLRTLSGGTRQKV